MIVSTKHGFMLARPCKTGSTTAQHEIVNSGILGEDDVYTGFKSGAVTLMGTLLLEEHATPLEALTDGVITVRQAAEMTLVCSLRHPLDTFYSRFLASPLQEDIMLFARELDSPASYLGRLQSDYFKGVAFKEVVVLHTATLTSCLGFFLARYGGVPSGVALRSRGKYLRAEEALSTAELEELTLILQPEIIFYTNMVSKCKNIQQY